MKNLSFIRTKTKKLSISLMALLLTLVSLTARPVLSTLAEEAVEKTQNVLDFNNVGVHDPSIIKVDDTYYVFGTHGAAAKSKDMKNWENFVDESDLTKHTLLGNINENFKDVFTWAGNADAVFMHEKGIWAPDVYYNENYVNEDGTTGAYLMYFSLSTGKEDGEEHYRSLIGLATAQNIEGPYTYEKEVIYSGFRNIEGNSHYEHTDFEYVFPGSSPRAGYFRNNGSFNFDMFPNAIDPTIVEGNDGKLYMSYGSWNGGIWVLELDAETGLPVRPENYNNGTGPDGSESYFGTKISGGFRTSGEGSYISYHEESGYYHLYVTYGGLEQGSNYNIRFFRSENITGPYVDSDGNNPNFSERVGNDKYGNKLLGSFEFQENQAFEKDAKAYDYRVPGHNSVLYGDDGQDYIYFHTRFKDTGEAHELRVHQIVFDEDGWPMIAPQRFAGESVLTEGINPVGSVLLVKQDKDNANGSKLSQGVSLNKDGSVSGAYTGTWSLEDNKLNLTIGEDTYSGYTFKQSSAITNWYEDLTFTLLGTSANVKGVSLLGIKVSDLTGADVLKSAKEDLEVSNTERVVRDLELPTSAAGGVSVVWSSSEEAIMTNTGKITKTDKDQNVTLTATLKYGDLTETKTFKLIVAAIDNDNFIEYKFEGDLSETNGKLDDAHSTVDRPHLPGGNEEYRPGFVLDENGLRGKAYYLDGASGIRLPNGLIQSNKYSVSLWVNPESTTVSTPAFFGMRDLKNWVSILPHGWDGNVLLWSGDVSWYDGFTGVKAELNTWSLYTVTVDNGTAKFYINGEEKFSGENFPDIFTGAENGEFAIGANFWDPAYKGLVDDLRVYQNDVLSANEIKDYYESQLTSITPEEVAEETFNSIKIQDVVTSDIELPTEGKYGSSLEWTTSNEAHITKTGKVTRPAAGEKDVEVTLTAKLTFEGETFTKTYKVLVKAIPQTIKYLHYTFDKSLKESTNNTLTAKLTGEILGHSGGKENYTTGIKGDAFYFDGKTGLELPDDMIQSNTYTVSFWAKPEELTGKTPAFFGANNHENWVSFLPMGWDEHVMLWAREEGNEKPLNWFDGQTHVKAAENVWTLYTLTVEDGNAKVYLNGEEKFAGSNLFNIFESSNVKKFALGVNYWDTAFKGHIDELIVYPESAMGAKQIQEYYESITSEMSPADKAEEIFAKLNLPKETSSNLELQTKVGQTSVKWATSNPTYITNSGKVTRPQAGQKDVSVKLTATIVVDGETFKKDFVVVVKAMPSKDDQIIYRFEKDLEASKEKLAGKVFGELIDKVGGNASYKTGILGNAVYLDGKTSVRLPNNLITSNNYTISMWLNPEQLTDFTSAFFASSAVDKWVSVVPRSGHANLDNSGLIWSGEQWYDGLFNQTLKTNTWQHVAFTVQDGAIKVYLDGQLVHDGKGFPEIFSKDATNVFSIGANYWDTPFKGMVDELMIVPNEAMSAVDIKAYRDGILSQLTPEKLLEQYFSSLVFGDNNVLTSDIVLPNNTPDNLKIDWHSTNTSYLTHDGKVTRPSAKDGDQTLKLSATVMLNGKPFTYKYDLVVKAESIKVDSVYYGFENTLDEASKLIGLSGQTTGKFVDVPGGKAKYKEGKVGQGLYLDGTSGVRLPDNLIGANKYSVSMWLKPEALTDFTTTFFGYRNADNWISFTPKGVASQAVLWSGTNWYDGLTNFVMSPNTWSHVAFTVDGGNVKVYVDGVLRHTGTNFPGIFNDKDDSVFALGVNYWDTPFKGVIDELMVHNTKILSASEIYDYYDETAGSDRFVRNVDRHLKLDFDNNIGPATVVGDKLDKSGGNVSYDEGVVGEAVYLNGSTGLSLPSGFLSSDTYSMQMWVKPEAITPYTSIFFGGTSNASWVNLPASGVNGKTMFWSGENWYDAITPDTIPANRWSHLAVNVAKGKVSVFIDGEEKFSGNDFPDIFTTPNTFAAIGVNFWDAAFRGYIDEFEINNNSVISAAAIKAYYDETKPEQEEFERNQEKTHIFKFEDNLVDDKNEELVGEVVGNMINVEGGNLEYVEGKDGKAIYLDGETGVLLPKELITSENYSVAFWLNPETITPHTTTFFGAQNDSSWVSVVPESGEFTNGNTMVWSGTNWYDGNLGKQIPTDEWSHIAFTVEEGVLNAYLNGEKVFTGEGFPDVFNAEDSVFALGVNYWDAAFVGMIDELMVFDSHVISSDDVSSIVAGEFDLSDKENLEEEEEIETENSSSNIPLYVGGGVGVGAIAYVISILLKKKETGV